MRDLLWMEIDLNQIKANINYIQKVSKKKLIPVIKSGAYNIGDDVVNNLTRELNLDYVAVVDMLEALKLLKENSNYNILILNSLDKSEYKYLNQYPNLTISINKIEDVHNLENIKLERNLKVHLQIDTGMNRLGFKNIDEFLNSLSILKSNNNIILEGLYTHFSSLDNSINQLEKFKQFTNVFDFPMVHACATSTYKEIDYGNYVRVGLDVYGVNQDMQSIKIACLPIEIRNIKKGESIGYDENYIAEKDLKIAVLPIGYANGYRRSLQGYKVLVNNKFYNTIGKVCMNHLFVEIDDSVDYNSEFIITSRKHPIEDMAKYLDTTCHEILCMFNVSKRIYIR